MGYYTNFDIVLSDDCPNFKDFCEENGLELSGRTAYVNAKWYSWEDDFRQFSKENPSVIITVCGSGENDGDLWRAYFKAGKMQLCPATITYESYDESKLV